VLLGLALSIFLACGYFLRGEEVFDVRVLWIPEGSWQKKDQVLYEESWGRFTLEQVIFTPKVFDADGQEVPGAVGNFITKDKAALLEAFDTLQDIVQLKGVGQGAEYEFEELCYQPAAPFAPGCLMYSPFDYWRNDRQALIDDDQIEITLSDLYAPGSIDGLEVGRENVALFSP